MKFLFFVLYLLFYIQDITSQEISNLYIPHLESLAQKNEPFAQDFNDYIITNSHVSQRSNLTHFYLNQRFQGIEIKNAVLSIHLDKEGKLVNLNNQFLLDLSSRISVKTPAISASDAITIVAQNLNYNITNILELIRVEVGPSMKHTFGKAGISQIDIPVKLIYQPIQNGAIKLAWDVSILETTGNDWWSIRVDAVSGEILDQENWTLNCNFHEKDPSADHLNCTGSDFHFTKFKNYKTIGNNIMVPNSYNVFPLGIESPNHGNRILEVDPADNLASPYGWHDTNGIVGAEFTTTKGNNTESKDDLLGDDEATIGNFADGTSNLTFDFSLNNSLPPSANINASLTNLFYWNNIMHDVWYQYGFDEAAGNFQQNNYGRGGIGNDFVRADGLDGEGNNNANFSTPSDGSKPRMQMFLWNASNNALTVTINTPGNILGNYTGIKAGFGPTEYNVTGDLLLADPIIACGSLTNSSAMNGKIALIDRGSCEFGTKCLNAQNAGAIAVLVCNNVADAPISMGAGANGASVNIPCIMLSQADCNLIKLNLPGVNITFTGIGIQLDGSFDNGIIAHEYGHGISNRLTGGAANVSCLNNQEQMGEGWSDWFGLMLTMRAGDSGSTGKGIGTYALGQSVSGNGIRQYRYSNNMSVNPHTYDNIKTASLPHGVGSVWCAVLWDMTWLFIDAYGFDTDYYTGTGGNNIAMALVTEALKLQPCSPGFVDGRNAILLADNVLYGGIHSCLIWKAFAARGLGFSANQGLSSSRSDGTQAFDMPTSCCNQVFVKDNSGIGSLRSALDCVSSGSTITFAPFMDQKKIDLTGGITINKNVNIISDTPNGVKINTNDLVPTLIINNYNVSLQNITLMAGNANSGRVLINNGNLNCNNVSFIDAQMLNGAGESIINNGTMIFSGGSILKRE